MELNNVIIFLTVFSSQAVKFFNQPSVFKAFKKGMSFWCVIKHNDNFFPNFCKNFGEKPRVRNTLKDVENIKWKHFKSNGMNRNYRIIWKAVSPDELGDR